MIVFEYAHREGDYIVVDSDGLARIRNLLWIAAHQRRTKLAKEGIRSGGYNEQLVFGDKVMSELFSDAKEIRVKVDPDKWASLDKKIGAELRKLNK
jgi:hypothetical protein